MIFRDKRLLNIILIIFITIIAIVLIRIVSKSFNGDRPASDVFSLNEFRDVSSDLIDYKEYLQIDLDRTVNPIDIAYNNGAYFLLTDSYLLSFNAEGTEKNRFDIEGHANCVYVFDNGNIIVGFDEYLIVYDTEGNELHRTQSKKVGSIFTGIAISENNTIFAADAGRKEIMIFCDTLSLVDSFSGYSAVSDLHGFILPSSHFDIAINGENELWAVNPGVHSIQNYSENGRIRGYWSNASFSHDGFSGCCNPYFIDFLSNGNIVTSEKGLVRVKVHNISGQFLSYVAPPNAFENTNKAPSIAIDSNDNIIILDYDNYILRFFTHKNKAL